MRLLRSRRLDDDVFVLPEPAVVREPRVGCPGLDDDLQRLLEARLRLLVRRGAAAIVLIPGAPLGVITLAVQALAEVLLPSASVFLLLLCNDPEVLGPWRNPAWLNALACVIVAVLVLFSLILMATTVFPSINVTAVALGGGVVLAVGLLAFGAVTARSQRGGEQVTFIDTGPTIPKEQWTMPPLALLARPQWSTGLKTAMLVLRGYLVISVALLIVKAVQLGGG
jgi:hypothetical protein